MSESINNFNQPVGFRLDSANRTYYTVCRGFWTTLRALLETDYLAQTAFDFVKKGLPEHIVVEAPSMAQAADVAVRLLPLLRERYILENNAAMFAGLNTPFQMLEKARAMTGSNAGPERGEEEILTAWKGTNDTKATLPTAGRPETMPLFVPENCLDSCSAIEMKNRRSPVVLLRLTDFDYTDTNLIYTDSSDWPVFTVAAPPVKWYAMLLSNCYFALSQGMRRIIRSHCEIIVEKLNFTCENDIIDACTYVRRHEGGRPVGWDDFVNAIRNVPCNSKLRGLNPYESTVQYRINCSGCRSLPMLNKVAMMRACEAMRKTLPTPYAVPENAPITTLQGRTLDNHLLNEYGTQPCLSNDVGTMFHVVLVGKTFCVEEFAVSPGVTLADVLTKAEENYSKSAPDEAESEHAAPDQWLLVMDSTPFRSYMEIEEQLTKYRFAIHLTADGGEVYEGPLALRKFDEGIRPLAERAAEHPIDWTKTEL